MNRLHLTLPFIFSYFLLLGLSACTAESYAHPPEDLTISDLIGVWETKYGNKIIDRITINEDGLFQQTYENSNTGYYFESGWQPVEVERVDNGSVYIVFHNARYYPAGEKNRRTGWHGVSLPT